MAVLRQNYLDDAACSGFDYSGDILQIHASPLRKRMTQTMNQKRLGLLGVQMALAIGAVSAMQAPALAQTTPFGPWPEPPPSYGMPSSPLVAGYILRSFQSTTLSASFSVSTKKLQALLPAGWTALSLPTGSSVVRVACGWSTKIVLTKPVAGYAAGTYGPYNEAVVSTYAFNTGNTALQTYTFAALEDNQEAVDLFTAIFGAGSAQYADITLRINETDSALASSCTVREQPSGLHFHLTLQGPDQTISQVRPSSPGAVAGLIKIGAGPSLWVSGGADNVVVPPSGVTLNVGSLTLPGGALPILGIMPSSSGFVAGFSSNGEAFYAPQ